MPHKSVFNEAVKGLLNDESSLGASSRLQLDLSACTVQNMRFQIEPTELAKLSCHEIGLKLQKSCF